MRTLIITTALAVAVAAGCQGHPAPTATTVRTATEQTATAPAAESRGERGTTLPTKYAPYADVVWPTPTAPAWMEQLGGPSTGQGGPGGPVRRTGLSGAGETKEKLLSLEIAYSYDATPYDRSEWGEWIDVDGDCQDTRAEVLQEESRIGVTFRSTVHCRVDAGEWIGPWSGQRFTLAVDLDVDHHVPLANAHRSGAAGWPAAKKRAYANDRRIAGALNATMNTLNRQKGAKGPEEWRPPDRASWCRYATDWIEVKSAWELSTRRESCGR